MSNFEELQGNLISPKVYNPSRERSETRLPIPSLWRGTPPGLVIIRESLGGWDQVVSRISIFIHAETAQRRGLICPCSG